MFASRLIKSDGTIEPIEINPEIFNQKDISFLGDKEFVKYCKLNHTDEFKIVEYLEYLEKKDLSGNKDLFQKIYGDEGLLDVESKITIMQRDNPKRYGDLVDLISELQNISSKIDYRKEFHKNKATSKEEQKVRYDEERFETISKITGVKINDLKDLSQKHNEEIKMKKEIPQKQTGIEI